MKIGVVLPLGEDEQTGRPSPYSEIRDLALQIEDQGFDSAWVFDHLLFRFPGEPTAGIWEAWSVEAAIANATHRVELGQLVLCTPFRNPAVLAKMAVTVDEISGGRLILGLGAGWHEPEFKAFGVPFDHRVGRFEEAIQIIRPLLKDGHVDFHGKYYSADDAVMAPASDRPGGIPILVASSGPRMLRLTAEYADMWNTAWLGRASGLQERREKLDAALREVGRDPGTLQVTVGVTVYYEELAKGEEKPKNYIGGAAEEVAQALQEYDDAGVAHVICAVNPTTSQAISLLSDAVRMYRAERR